MSQKTKIEYRYRIADIIQSGPFLLYGYLKNSAVAKTAYLIGHPDEHDGLSPIVRSYPRTVIL